jgi:vacuolar protein sorting-associated protein 13A/C
LASAITGVVVRPIEGAEKEGFGGFFKGLGKGLVGAVTKPVVGVFDLMSNVSEGIRNTTTVFDKELERQRLPRFIPKGGYIKPYNYQESFGSYCLKGLASDGHENEEYLGHVEMPQDQLIVICTKQTLLFAQINKLSVELPIPFTGKLYYY